MWWKFLAVKWKDNKSVCLASNCYVVCPISQARRFSQKQEKHIQVRQPALKKNYNQQMRGVDILDRSIYQYRPAIT
jgi:hypothetical protein